MVEYIYNTYKYNTHVSFEVFPPKGNQGRRQIYQTIANLKNIKPDFFSVTYGAGGSTAEKSLEIASALTNLAQVNCVAHITCVGMNRQDVKELLESLQYHGISNVLALRGDPPEGDDTFKKPENGFEYADELVSFIREQSSMGILVAGYPEGHKENPLKEQDFRFLVRKVNSGANGIITQLFFDNRYMYEFMDKLQGANVTVPVIAGIFPISDARQIKRIVALSGASVPKELQEGLNTYEKSPEDMERFGTDYAVQQVQNLLENGVNYFHFYTMNRYRQTRAILGQLKTYFPRLTID